MQKGNENLFSEIRFSLPAPFESLEAIRARALPYNLTVEGFLPVLNKEQKWKSFFRIRLGDWPIVISYSLLSSPDDRLDSQAVVQMRKSKVGLSQGWINFYIRFLNLKNTNIFNPAYVNAMHLDHDDQYCEQEETYENDISI